MATPNKASDPPRQSAAPKRKNKLLIRKRVNPMFLTIGGLVVAGLFTLAGMLYNHDDKRLAILTFLVAGVFTLVIICKVWADSVGAPLIQETLAPTPSPPVPTPAATPEPQTPMSNTNITSHNQSGGFTGINQGTVNLGSNPRIISTHDRTAFKTLVANAPKGRVDISHIANEPEILSFAKQLEDLLKDAGYQAQISHSFTGVSNPPVIGVIVAVHDGKKVPIYADPLRNALSSINITTKAVQDFSGEDSIRLMVGPRPLDPSPTQ
jgi:hypothetical protein